MRKTTALANCKLNMLLYGEDRRTCSSVLLKNLRHQTI